MSEQQQEQQPVKSRLSAEATYEKLRQSPDALNSVWAPGPDQGVFDEVMDGAETLERARAHFARGPYRKPERPPAEQPAEQPTVEPGQAGKGQFAHLTADELKALSDSVFEEELARGMYGTDPGPTEDDEELLDV